MIFFIESSESLMVFCVMDEGTLECLPSSAPDWASPWHYNDLDDLEKPNLNACNGPES